MPIGLSRMGQMGVRSTPMSELNQIIALLRSVGGSLYLPGQTNRVSADGSGDFVFDGDVVGYAPDLVGGGNALTQSTTANKPTLGKVAARDVYTLGFDGLNDALTASNSTTLDDGLVIVFAGRIDSIKTARMLRLRNAANSRALMISQTSINQLGATITGASGSVSVYGQYTVGETTICSAILRGGNLILRKNGVQLGSQTINQGVVDSLGISTIGGDVGISFSDMELIGAAHANFGSLATDENIRKIESYFAKLAGVTL